MANKQKTTKPAKKKKTNSKKKKRLTKLEKRHLIDTLLAYKAKGYRYTDLVQIGMKLRGVSERQAKTYVKWAVAEEAALASKSDEEAYGHMINRVSVLCTQAVRDGNLEMANKLTLTEVKLRDSMKKQPKRGKLSHETNSVFDSEVFSEDELAKILAAFEEDGAA